MSQISAQREIELREALRRLNQLQPWRKDDSGRSK